MATKKSVKPVTSFAIGDAVEWGSQAGGSTKFKAGKIVYVAPEGSEGADRVRKFIDNKVKAGTHRSVFGGGWGRPEISYIVEVDGPSPKAKKVLYWPRTNALKQTN